MKSSLPIELFEKMSIDGGLKGSHLHLSDGGTSANHISSVQVTGRQLKQARALTSESVISGPYTITFS